MLRELPTSSFDVFSSRTSKRGHGRRSAMISLVPARAFPRDSGALRTFAVTIRIFVARFLRRCSVLISLTPAVGFLSAWRVRFRSRNLDSRNRAHARAENALASGAANAYSCRAETHFSAPSRAGLLLVSGSLRRRLDVVTRCPHEASAATEDV